MVLGESPREPPPSPTSLAVKDEESSDDESQSPAGWREWGIEPFDFSKSFDDLSSEPSVESDGEVPNIAADSRGNVDHGLNLAALAVGPMPPSPVSPGQKETSSYITPAKRATEMEVDPGSTMKKLKFAEASGDAEASGKPIAEDTWRYIDLGLRVTVLAGFSGFGVWSLSMMRLGAFLSHSDSCSLLRKLSIKRWTLWGSTNSLRSIPA